MRQLKMPEKFSLHFKNGIEIRKEKKRYVLWMWNIDVTSFSSISYYSNSEIDLKNSIPDQSSWTLSNIKRWTELGALVVLPFFLTDT